ncbi:MAG: AsmA family protein [Candidatus Omnitrophica bacterium]|nr:AsmA family protein [Candidatus Omnitrophota bacterium]
MEILKKIFLTVFLAVVLLFVGISIYIHKNGKVLIEERLSAALHKEVHVGKARLLFPLGLRFDSVEIKDALTAKVLRINLGVPIFFGDHFNIAKIKLTEPVFLITYSKDKKIVWGTLPDAVAAAPDVVAPEVPTAPAKPAKSSQGIIIDYLEVSNGRVKVIDQPHNSDFEIGQINLKAMELTLPPKNMKTKFDLSAVVLSENAPFAGQRAEARGMANFVALNMDAVAKVVDPSGNSSFSAHFKSVNNDMLVKGTINVGRFVSGIKTKGSSESSLEGFLANALESSGVEIGIKFSCQTKMNDFNCDKIGMSGNVVQNGPNSETLPAADPQPAP